MASRIYNSLLINPVVLNFLNLNKSNTKDYDWKFMNESGETRTVSVKTETREGFNYNQLIDLNKVSNPDTTIIGDKYNGYYWVNYLSANDVLYIRIDRCEDYKFNEFVEEVISAYQVNKPEKVIFDLRKNQGGNSSYIPLLITQLKSNTDIDSKSISYLLIDNLTFSAGVDGALEIKKKLSTTIFGSETGGNVNSFGNIIPITLPHSKFVFTVSTEWFPMDSSYKHGLTPDIACVPIYND